MGGVEMIMISLLLATIFIMVTVLINDKTEGKFVSAIIDCVIIYVACYFLVHEIFKITGLK